MERHKSFTLQLSADPKNMAIYNPGLAGHGAK